MKCSQREVFLLPTPTHLQNSSFSLHIIQKNHFSRQGGCACHGNKENSVASKGMGDLFQHVLVTGWEECRGKVCRDCWALWMEADEYP